MGRYFFHLHDGRRLLEDYEGREFRSSEEAAAYAIVNARDVMSGEIRRGHLDLTWYILITEHSDDVVDQISFADAVVVRVPDRRT
ncbi:hypothetical protein SAMN03159338_3828 [Sphingomonas sp. NFR04]|uniref:DUF6894 family protein n=1 Tax=Sphingomonas sp. NFR04 TaxID=1566283 RepID=UPI0008F243B2|nr:hypothetical protein [Sphingomonas sp. NFR04]SFK28263.1 hypothetical protein SAMN03159338_3828 [Sphingomonas sp. NFR04]